MVIELLDDMGIPLPERAPTSSRTSFSGGMRQRAMIAMALACDPKILIADEPTTALDVTIQAQILDLMNAEGASTAPAIMLITHDLGVVAEMADEVAVMYAGNIVEAAARSTTLRRARAPLYPRAARERSRARTRRASGTAARADLDRSRAWCPALRPPPARRCPFADALRAYVPATEGRDASPALNRASVETYFPRRPRHRGPVKAVDGVEEDREIADRGRAAKVPALEVVRRPGQVKHFPMRPGGLLRTSARRRGQGRRRRRLHHRRGRDAGPGRRVRLRQVDEFSGPRSASRACIEPTEGLRSAASARTILASSNS